MERFRLEQYVLSTDRDKLFQSNMVFEQNGSMENACEGVFGMKVSNFPPNAKYIKVTGGRKACPLALWEIENRKEIITQTYSFGIEDELHAVAINDRLEIIGSAHFKPNCTNHNKCQSEKMYECEATGVSNVTNEKEKYVGDYIGSLPLGKAMLEAEKNTLKICQENASGCTILEGSCAYKGKMRGFCDGQGNRKMFDTSNRKQQSPTIGLKDAFKRICGIIDINFDE